MTGSIHSLFLRHLKIILLSLLILPLLSGCDLNIHIGSSAPDDDDDSQSPSPEYWIPAQGSHWQIQLQNINRLNIVRGTDIYEIDLFDGSANHFKVIHQLKKQNKKVICYFSAGTREDWRPDASKLTRESMIPNGELEDWPGEVWLDISNKKVLERVIKPVMKKRLDLARDAGCDAVDPDNVDAYSNTEETHEIISYADQLAYNIWLAKAAHQRGLGIALKNDINQLDILVKYYDFAVNEQCFAYNECDVYKDNFLSAGKAVFNQEYDEDGADGEVSKKEFRNDACPTFRKARISGLWKQGYSLDGKNVSSCP